MDFITDPKAIENKSMDIIYELIGKMGKTPEEEKIIKRVVHTTGDPEYAKLVEIHPEAVEKGLAALKRGCRVFTDVNMVKTGINAKKLTELGGEALCYINHPEVVAEALRTGETRAMTAMKRVAKEIDGNILAIGNAPTALFVVLEAVKTLGVKPALIVGIPVGFVGAAESKEELVQSGLPYITVRGTKGGSTIAVSVVNALLYMC
ncbi:MAG TPA: precorrin-8X methylmutase [Bacillota bacterium]|nr:precorrin-8X methylmutase [Bacillota bacterium]